jgi:DNA-binding XRE family transcriptional regulator
MESRHLGLAMLTPMECQAARARLQWTRDTLAREAGVEVSTIIAFELEQGPAPTVVVAALTGALEAAQMTPRLSETGSQLPAQR